MEKQRKFSAFAKNHGVILEYAVLFVIACFVVPSFFSVSAVFTVIKQAAVPCVAVMGMMLVLTTGGIDLSLANTVGLCSVVLGVLTVLNGWPAWAAILITLLVGALVGLMNGCIVQYLRVPAFIATTGSGYVIYGIAQIIGKGEQFNQLPEDLKAFGTTKLFNFIYEALPEGLQEVKLLKTFLRLPSYVWISVAIVLLMYFVRHKTVYGRNLSAFGFNAKTARLSGIRTHRLHVMTYMICSVLVAMASVLLSIRAGCCQSNLGGLNYTFDIVTAAVVAGTSLYGGVSSVLNCVFGVFITKTIEVSINMLKVNYYLFKPCLGLVILIAIVLEAYKNRKL